MNQENIGKIIINIRKNNNLTQLELGNILGVTSQAVSKWENGRGIPDIEILQKISKTFNLDLNEMLDGHINKKKKNNKNILLIIGFILLIGAILFIVLKNNNFEFATISSKNDNFKVSGVAAYSSDKKSIFISNIEYLGDEKEDNKYTVVECSLYETVNNVEKKISQCGDLSTEENDAPTELSNLLKNVEVNVGDYSSMCKHYNKHTLYLRINAKDTSNKVVTYNIPIELNEKCDG